METSTQATFSSCRRRAQNRYEQPYPSEAPPGTLNPVPVKVIDLGSSQLAETHATIGKARENWFLVDNLRKILKPLFENGESLKKWILLEKFKLGGSIPTFKIPGTKYLPVPGELTSDMYRLLCVMNVLLGHLNSWRDNGTDAPLTRPALDHTDIAILNQLITGGPAGLRDNVFSLDVLAVLEVLSCPEGDASYVRWQAVIDWGSMNPGSQKYEIQESGISLVRASRG